MSSCQALELLFREVFFDKHNTLLLGGYDEPVYWPANFNVGIEASNVHRLCYREDFFSSALHEVAHWCIAGEDRRKQVDFGYWYFPEGRTEKQQLAFQQVEVYPQALEWIFTVATGHQFRVSVDNFPQETGFKQEQQNTQEQNTRAFAESVRQKVLEIQQNGLPERARLFVDALSLKYAVSDPYDPENYQKCPW